MKNKRVPLKYIKFIKDIYNGAITSVRTCECIKNEFPITIGLHQGSTLNPYLFAQVADELMKSIENLLIYAFCRWYSLSGWN